MIKNEAPTRFRALSVRDWVPLITDDHCYRPGHLDSQAGCQGNWPSGGEAVPTPRCRHTARRPTSMTRTQGRECSASSVGAILSHRSARVDPLQQGARCASCVFSSATGTPGRTSWFSPDWRSRPAIRAPARPGLPRHQRAGENHIVEQARLKIGKLAGVWLILVTLPGSMLAFPCWRSDQHCVDKPCRACRATSPQPSMISNLPPPTVRQSADDPTFWASGQDISTLSARQDSAGTRLDAQRRSSLIRDYLLARP